MGAQLDRLQPGSLAFKLDWRNSVRLQSQIFRDNSVVIQPKGVSSVRLRPLLFRDNSLDFKLEGGSHLWLRPGGDNSLQLKPEEGNRLNSQLGEGRGLNFQQEEDNRVPLRRQWVRDNSLAFKPEEVSSVRLRLQFVRGHRLGSQPGEASNLRLKLGGDISVWLRPQLFQGSSSLNLQLIGGDKLGFQPEGSLRLRVELLEVFFKHPLDSQIQGEVRLQVRCVLLNSLVETGVIGCVERGSLESDGSSVSLFLWSWGLASCFGSTFTHIGKSRSAMFPSASAHLLALFD